MKKSLLILLCALFAFNISAQRIVSSSVSIANTFAIQKEKSSFIDTLFDFFTGSPALYSVVGGGYLAGHNSHGDIGKMQKFHTSQGGYITDVLYWFGHKEGSGTIYAVIWNDNNGIPGNRIGNVVFPISYIDTTNLSTLTSIPFINPVQIPVNLTFWVGFEYSYSPGDTVGLVTNTDGDFPNAITDTYEEWGDSTFHSVADVSSWGIDIAFAIFPVVMWDTTYYNTIKGNIFIDSNENGIKDSLENGISNQIVNAYQSYDVTDAYGNYSLTVDTGFYTVKHIVQDYITSDPDSLIVHFSGIGFSSNGNNFACQVIQGIRDLSVSLVAGAFRPGFDSEYYLFIKNEGTQIESGTAALSYDPQLNYQYSSPIEDSVSGNSVFWNFTNLIPGGTLLINTIVETPQSLPIGTELISSAYVIPLIDDTVPENNYDTLYHVVTGSYDPNDKLVYPAGSGTQGYIGFDPIQLEYTIRFQNTGTDTAFTVVIKDTLNENLNLGTLKTLSSSHPVSLSLANSNVLNFTFNNILLPDSNINQLGSNGFVKYSVSLKSGLAQGTEITNNAYIYFDYNQPVVTNTTLNTIGLLVNIPEVEITSEASQIFPNPMNISATIKLTTENKVENSTLQIYDILGNLVLSKKDVNTNEIIIYRGNLRSGIYFYKISNDKKIFASGKFIIE